MSADRVHLTTGEDLEDLLQAASTPVLVAFCASWSGPSTMLSPLLEEIAQEQADLLQVVKVDIDEARPLAVRYGVRQLPTLLLFQGGDVVARLIGYMPRERLLSRLLPLIRPESPP